MSRTPWKIALTFCLLVCAGSAPAWSQDQELTARFSGAELIEQLQQGGKVVLMRHMTTAPARNDPELIDLDDCSTQRNLNEVGRDQATKLGEAFRKLSIPVTEVISSPYCRCVETGEIAFGEVKKSELLAIGVGLEAKEKIEGGSDVRKLLDTEAPDGGNTILITHNVNLLYAFGLEPKPEGVAHVFKPTGIGFATYLGKIVPDDWVEAVKEEGGTL